MCVHDKQEEPVVTWQGSIQCDCCHRDASRVGNHFYDTRTKFGTRWALLCEECYKNIGIGKLGTGFGQQYSTTSRHKTAG